MLRFLVRLARWVSWSDGEACTSSVNNILPQFKALQMVGYSGNMPFSKPCGHLPGELEEIEGFPSIYNKEQFMGWFYLLALQYVVAIRLRDIMELKQARQPKFKCNLGNLCTLVLAWSTVTEEDVLFLLG